MLINLPKWKELKLENSINEDIIHLRKEFLRSFTELLCNVLQKIITNFVRYPNIIRCSGKNLDTMNL